MPKGIQIINEDGTKFDLSTDSSLQEILQALGIESGTDILAELQKIVDNASNGNTKVIIWDGINEADVTATGRLQVDSGSPTPPPETTPVKEEEYSDVAVLDDNIFVIPDTETLQITRFSAGGQQTQGGNVIELWYDPNGNGIGMTIIDVIFADGTSDQHDINFTALGDGTKQIRMSRRRLSGGAVLLYGSWEGYY